MALLPLLSVTVRVTVLAPTSEQVKSSMSKVLEAMPQASEDPLFTSLAVVDPFPVASRYTVGGAWQTAFGA